MLTTFYWNGTTHQDTYRHFISCSLSHYILQLSLIYFSLALVQLCDSFILIRKNVTVLLFTHEQIVERQVLGKPNQSWLLVDTQSSNLTHHERKQTNTQHFYWLLTLRRQEWRMNQDGAAATGWCEQSDVMGRAPAWRAAAAGMTLLLQGWITSAQHMSITPVR